MKNLYAACLAFVAICAVASPAFAQYVDRDDSARFDEDLDKDQFSVEARTAVIDVPGFVLGWFFDHHENQWTKGQKNFAYGAEFTWKRHHQFEIGVGVDWADLRMPDGFWLKNGDAMSEADWTKVTIQMLSVTFFTRRSWEVNQWFSPYLGASIGPGIVFGKVLKYNPSPGTQCRSQLSAGSFAPPPCFDSNGKPKLSSQFDAPVREKGVPPIAPVLGLSGGLKFTFAKHGMFKIEAGLRDYLFAGIGLGVTW